MTIHIPLWLLWALGSVACAGILALVWYEVWAWHTTRRLHRDIERAMARHFR